MADYIERSVAKDELLSWAVCIKHPEHLLKEDAMCVLDNIPAADVAPVVRCKDCKRGEADDPEFFPDQYYCHAGCGWNKADFYCADGERKDGGDNAKK
jgi:hypothetical protein